MPRATPDETRMEMTPMIDVTFLLLIFFLCSLRLTRLEGKLSAALPEDQGHSIAPLPPLERLEISWRRRAPYPGHWQDEHIALRVGPRAVSGQAELRRILHRIRRDAPETRVLLIPAAGTVYDDAVQVVNTCLAAGLSRLSFAPAPAR